MFRITKFYIKVSFIMKFAGIGFIVFSCNTKKVETSAEIKINPPETESGAITVPPIKQPDYFLILKSQAESYQKCLDKGAFMMECARKYSTQMDSMLNIVYRQLINKYDQDKKQKLKIEQRAWIKERDNKFKEIWANANADGPMSMDDMMIVYDDEADYIKQRVEQLIYKLQNISSSNEKPFDESYLGAWVIKSFFIRRVSGIGEEEASTYVGKSILFSQERFTTPFSSDFCSIISLSKANISIDSEIKVNFNLTKDRFEELGIHCGNYDTYFIILSNDKAIIENDGGVYLLEKL